MRIAPVTKDADTAALAAFFELAADYVKLETGAAPDSTTVADFFDDLPPNGSSDRAAHFGLFENGRIIGVLAMSFGYPRATDAYIGYLVLAQTARGCGRGALALAHATTTARARGATRLLVAVLESNPKGCAFWEHQGFTLEQTFPDTGDGHIRHRLGRPV